MSSALWITAFLLGLFGIVLIHEAGHYVAARVFGFRVLEYFAGFGPRLWSFRRGEIEYGVKALPVGGYVKIAGMNPLENDVPPGDEDRAYFAKPIWQRAVVILAGPISHFVVAMIVFAGLYATTGLGHPDNMLTGIGQITPRIAGEASPAAAAGLRPGDLIVRIGDIDLPRSDQIGEYLGERAGEPVAFAFERDGERFERTLVPAVDVIDGREVPRIGVVIGLEPVRRGIGEAVALAVGDLGRYTAESVGGIAKVFGPEGVGRMFTLLFTDEQRSEEDPASLIGISRQVGATGEAGGADAVLLVFAYVTLFIGIINLVPLPPLDGGHLALLAIERIRGRAVDLRRVIPVSAAVLVFLVTFVSAAVILDIAKPIPLP
ncbi:MAG TPA: site-2 protease family protein [Actinomycetota bacterium]|nr:site-2 protease family protein [Actinomycetota bacterium]